MDASRWILPDLASALAWAKERNRQGIRCTLALAGEYAGTPGEASRAAGENIACVGAIAAEKVDASLAVKPGGIGGLLDPAVCRDLALRIAREAARAGVPLELDMEGKGSVDLTLALAEGCRDEGARVTVALQAYLDRTEGDIRRMVSRGIGIRLVKGAYLGDVSGFVEIRRRTEACAGFLKGFRIPFSLGTHDPVLIGWAREEFGRERELLEFGFLKGLSDGTKAGLAAGGWRVSEYVPCGQGGEAYVRRRERYLGDLARLGLSPAP